MTGKLKDPPPYEGTEVNKQITCQFCQESEGNKSRDKIFFNNLFIYIAFEYDFARVETWGHLTKFDIIYYLK